MTREEAAEILEEVRTMDDSMYQYNPVYLEAIDMAIKALKAEPCGDAVSLDSVIDTIEWYRTNPQHFTEDNLIEDIKGLPPVTPKQKWIPVSESLPRLGENVLVSYETEDGTKIAISSFSKYGCICGDATAWMPLPEPYKEGESE